MNKTSISKSGLILTLALLVPSLAQAHAGAGSTQGFLHGIGHPVSGLDHVCAMIAVGLGAMQRGGRAIWLVPLTFVAVMTLGGALGMIGLSMPFVEKGIVVSVFMLGVFIAAAVRLPLVVSTLIVGLFALFHGHAHGAEMPETASGFAYAAGFILATCSLHACGIGIAIFLKRAAGLQWVRLAGGAIAACGLYLGLAA